MDFEDRPRRKLLVLVADRLILGEALITLVDPVAIGVRGDPLPGDRLQVLGAEGAEFVLAAEVVADVAIVQRAFLAGWVLRALDEEQDGDRVLASAAEYFTPFLLPVGVSLVPAQVVAIDCTEFLDQ